MLFERYHGERSRARLHQRRLAPHGCDLVTSRPHRADEECRPELTAMRLAKRQIEVRSWHFRHRTILAVFHHSDDGDPASVFVATNSAAHRVAASEESPGEGLVHDGHLGGLRSVLLGEVAATQERNAQRVEVPRRHRGVAGTRVFLPARRVSFNLKLRPGTVAESERYVEAIANCGDPRPRGQPVMQTDRELLALLTGGADRKST